MITLVEFSVKKYYNKGKRYKENITMGLGSNLFYARKNSGLSQETVAEKLGISRQTVSKWETEGSLR